MSSSATDPTSTTGSSGNWGSDRVGGPGGSSPRAGTVSGNWGSEIVTCGALAGHIRAIAARRGWPLRVHALPAALHNRPEKIPQAVESTLPGAVIGYADCGTYGKLDQLPGARRLPGLHCYDLYAGEDTISDVFHVEPGTYLLTDYLVRTFDRTVAGSLGLDRYPELWPDYFGHYTRVTWLAQEPTSELRAEAERIAARFGLPLTIIETGLSRLE